MLVYHLLAKFQPIVLYVQHIILNILIHIWCATPVETSEICPFINGVKECSAGWDGIHAKIVKSFYNIYLDILIHVFNLSITTGIFPKELKVVKVIALFKSQNSMVFNNYHPVSILPVFSIILEKLMHNRIMSFINKHKLLFEYQSGFRQKHGTDIALIVLLDKIMSSINDGEMCWGYFWIWVKLSIQ